ncbi:MAG: hypothetical protein ABSG23_03110 [Terriglobales bacterium]|jgi:hypothetical protein
MRSAAALSLAIQLTCSAICSGQIKMRLQDISVKGSPLHVSGAMLFEDDASKAVRYSYQVEGSIANMSGRGVVLVVIHFASSGVNGPSLDYTYQNDDFFSSDILQPGKDERFHSSPLRFGAPTVNGHPVPDDLDARSAPVATAQAMFVQFIDGSTWGDADLGREPLVVRNQTLTELRRLQRVLAQEGEQALKNELSKSENLLPCISAVMDICSDKAASCLAAGLRSMIEAARQHQIDMKAKSALFGDVVR